MKRVFMGAILLVLYPFAILRSVWEAAFYRAPSTSDFGDRHDNMATLLATIKVTCFAAIYTALVLWGAWKGFSWLARVMKAAMQ
ncbi:MAG: hypothetical protein ACRD59_02875 [Candidatus Acidiferrales bacterium]